MTIDLAVVSLWIAFAFAAGGLSKGVLGMGLPTIAMGLLTLVMTPAAAATLIIVPSLVTNLWQAMDGRALRSLLLRFWALFAALATGTLIGIGWITKADSALAPFLLGTVLIVYSTLAALRPVFRVPPRLEPVASPVVGLFTGLISGSTGIFVVPVVPYLQALGLSRNELVQAFGLSFTLSTIALAMGLASTAQLDGSTLVISAAALVPTAVGMLAGQVLRRRISERMFRHSFFALLFLLGMQLAMKAVLQE